MGFAREWTQQKITDVKGVDQGEVSRRIKYHKLSNTVKDFMEQGFLTEGHLKEITKIWVDPYFKEWLTPEKITLELAEKIKHDAGKNGSKTVKATCEDAKKIDSLQLFLTRN